MRASEEIAETLEVSVFYFYRWVNFVFAVVFLDVLIFCNYAGWTEGEAGAGAAC